MHPIHIPSCEGASDNLPCFLRVGDGDCKSDCFTDGTSDCTLVGCNVSKGDPCFVGSCDGDEDFDGVKEFDGL